MQSGPESSLAQPRDPLAAEPSASEVEEWASRERKRREAWLAGPTESEKAAWAQREADRRTHRGSGARHLPSVDLGEPVWMMQRYLREMQLATEGAASLLFKLSLSDAFDALVRAGRDWEDEFTAQPPRRRRVAMEEDVSDARTGRNKSRVPVPPEGSAGTS
jgi:hypothetical protein